MVLVIVLVEEAVVLLEDEVAPELTGPAVEDVGVPEPEVRPELVVVRGVVVAWFEVVGVLEVVVELARPCLLANLTRRVASAARSRWMTSRAGRSPGNTPCWNFGPPKSCRAAWSISSGTSLTSSWNCSSESARTCGVRHNRTKNNEARTEIERPNIADDSRERRQKRVRGLSRELREERRGGKENRNGS